MSQQWKAICKVEDIPVLGAGGITSSLLGLLAPFRCTTTVVRRSGEPVEGATRTVSTDRLDEVLGDALVVVLALALTEQTRHVIGAAQLRAMREDAWLVNVARGPHVDTDALVAALREGRIGGAALDVVHVAVDRAPPARGRVVARMAVIDHPQAEGPPSDAPPPRRRLIVTLAPEPRGAR